MSIDSYVFLFYTHTSTGPANVYAYTVNIWPLREVLTFTFPRFVGVEFELVDTTNQISKQDSNQQGRQEAMIIIHAANKMQALYSCGKMYEALLRH